MKKLAIIITHPIQYYVPIFQNLAKHCELKVFYTWGDDWLVNKYDPDFKQEVEWDIPLLNGYDYTFAKNAAKHPGSHHRSGINNPNLIKDIALFNPDCILIYGHAYKSHLEVIRHFKQKIRIFFRGDSTLLDDRRSIKSLLKKLYLRWLYTHIDLALYVGTNNKAYFKKFGVKEKQLIFAPHAVDNYRFSETDFNEASEIRERFGIGKNDIAILFAGKFEEKKDPIILLKAFNILNSKNLHIIYVGNGNLAPTLKEMAYGKNIHFLSFQNQTEMPSVYQAADIFCLPSQGPGETWGLAINEAMAAGKPIIASNKVGCAIDLIKEGENGYVFQAENVLDLTDKIRLILKRDFKQMGETSKRIIADWSFEKQTEQILIALNAKN